MNLQLLKDRRKLILFSFATSFLSGFGQSFFLSLFTPHLLSNLKLSNTTYGLIYSSATLVSGLLFPYIGGRLNYESPKRFILFSFIGLAFFSSVFAFVSHPIHLWVALLGLRFFGQGMMSHISSTIISARFTINRGKALSISNLGFPVSEALLPLIIVWMMSLFNVTSIWIIIAVTVMVFPFLTIPLLRDAETEPGHGPETSVDFQEFKGMKSLTFWYFATPAILPAFIFTALFLYHGVLLESRGLPYELIAVGLSSFAIARLISSLLAGALVDRFGSKKLFPLYLTPLTMGLILLALFKSKTFFILYLVLGGLTQGAASTIMNSIWAEIYGPKLLAKVRSQMVSLAVIGTAAGPFLFGSAIDYVLGVEGAVWMLTAIQTIIFLLGFILKKRITA